MKFTLSTKPLISALDLGVIPANVSKYYAKSCLAQLTASKSTLKINLEASLISSKLILKGSGDVDETATVFVDCLLLKQLVSTFESATTTIEYVEGGGIVLHSGSSKFNLPNMVEGVSLSLNAPSAVADATSPSIPVKADDWKFIKDYQMYAIAMSFVYPVYTNVWLGADGSVIVGDFGQQLFTASNKSALGATCLVTDTIINLFNTLPEGATLTQVGKSYLINYTSDAFTYAAEFTPKYESDEGVGDYKSGVILGVFNKDEANHFDVPVAEVLKRLNQAELLSANADDTIKLSIVHNGTDAVLKLVDNNTKHDIPVSGTCADFAVDFYIAKLKSVFNNIDEEVAHVSPVVDTTGAAQGITVWTKQIAVMLGGAE